MRRSKQTRRPATNLVSQAVVQRPRTVALQLAALLALVIAGLAAYCNSFSVPFVYDGVNMIELNPSVRDVWYWLRFWGEKHSSADDRPVGFLTFALNYAWGGYEVRGY